jgi:molybdenum cofactor synthesis domain-containing protein
MPSLSLRVKILTVSDSADAGEKEDTTGPLLATHLEEAGYQVIERRIVADGIEPVAAALRDMTRDFVGLVVTTGGTGFSPRDLTPEGSMLVIEREAPGLSGAMRSVNALGRLSRARAGIAGRSLILNTPGSPSGALENLDAVLDVLPHALELLRGEADPHPPDMGGSTATSSPGPTTVRESAGSPFTQI